ncbi:MBL fold metallo-hydrolase [Candidatus Nomurabacteria bacterium]|nr:MBL fold metallo-hydrolase [Candidatus Nomurabacteria bacterium]
MKIKKLGHCCLVIEVNGKRVMTDPGSFSTDQKDETNIDLILYTHEHQDHYHLETLKEVLKNNPNAKIITNTAVGKLLGGAGIEFTKVEDGEVFDFSGVQIKGFGNLHAEIYETYGQVQNTGYMIDGLCFPGDAFEDPKSQIDVLALPITGPWMRIKDAIDYAKMLKPRVVFPVHDAHIKDWAEFIYRVPESILKEYNIQFKKLELGKEENL